MVFVSRQAMTSIKTGSPISNISIIIYISLIHFRDKERGDMILSELCVAGIQLHSNIKNEQIAASPTHEEQCQVLHLTKLREEEEEELKQQLQTSNSTSAFQKMV